MMATGEIRFWSERNGRYFGLILDDATVDQPEPFTVFINEISLIAELKPAVRDTFKRGDRAAFEYDLTSVNDSRGPRAAPQTVSLIERKKPS
jgi:hypothetical protein